MSTDLVTIEGLNDEIKIAIEGNQNMRSAVTTYHKNNNPENELVDAWVSIYSNNILLMTVSSYEQWDAIFEAFRSLFSGPNEETIIAMFISANPDDCIF